MGRWGTGGTTYCGASRCTWAKGRGCQSSPFGDHPLELPPSCPQSYFGGGRGGGSALRNVPHLSRCVAVHRGTSKGSARGGGGGLWIHTADSGVPNAGYPLACRMCPRPNLAWDGQNKRHNPLLSHFTQLGDQIGITLYTSSLTGHSQYGHCHGMLLVDATRLAPILSWKTRWVCTRMCQHTLT